MSGAADSQHTTRTSTRFAKQGPTDLYQRVTDQVIDMLDKGVVPWRSPILGRTGARHPKNLHTGKPYRGVNVFLLAFTAWAKGYESAYWLTYKQAKDRGGHARKDEKSSMVVFWKQLEVKDKKTDEPKMVPLLRYYNVFNVTQCEGIPIPDPANFTPTPFNPIEAAEAIVKGYKDPPTIEHGGSQAFYVPATDTIRIPEPTRFNKNEEYYGTLYHELSHSSGHSKRLNRKLDSELRPFGSPDYSREEMIAEMSAAFLCAHAGIYPAVIDNTVSYISGWLGRLKQDKKLILQAASQAQRAADWILGVKPETTDAEQVEPAEGQGIG